MILDESTLLLQILTPAFLLILALVVGRVVDRVHIAWLRAREAELSSILASSMNTIPANWNLEQAFLVSGSVVIANDYFKSFVSAIRNLFGGRLPAYETLVERGRREAIVRMLEEARNGSANAVWNVRFVTTTLHGDEGGRAGGIELLAYGTALRVS